MRTLLVILMLTSYVLCDAQVRTWSGAGRTNLWTDPSNWVGGEVPDSPAESAFFDGTSSKNCFVNSSGPILDFTIGAG
ncbi:MAG: hypothetical protein AAGA85_24700, partial [Bacteroidota bacterium]